MVGAMKHALLKTLLVAATLAVAPLAGAADAACYADYKAKKAKPLKLHYGVIELPDAACRKPQRARRLIAKRIGRDGWQLLTVMSFFGPEGLAQRKDSAGRFYLRY